MKRGIILDGVTGSGKSTTLAALLRSTDFGRAAENIRIYHEDETFGEFMTELSDATRQPAWRCRRLSTVLERLEAGRDDRSSFLLERFHPSYFALLPTWDLYDDFDKRLSTLTTGIVVLVLPEHLLATRSLYRTDSRADTNELIAHYGDEATARAALRSSQEKRLESLRHSRLPNIVIDTAEMNWPLYADQIWKFWQSAL